MILKKRNNFTCDFCGKEIAGKAYQSNHTILCLDCGDEQLTYNDDVDSYVYWEDDYGVIYDDEGADIEIFEVVVI